MLNNLSSYEEIKNNRAESALAACLRGGRLSHAILVEGTRDVSAFAQKVAKAVVCESAGDKPCNACKQCAKAEKGIHPDIIVRSGGEQSRSFHVDSIRELRQTAYLKPNDAESKAIILENAQNMTVQAQNALLKIIEEPPRSVTFILTCENKSALLETVLSRVSVFSVDGGVIPESEPEAGEYGEKAARIVEALLSGNELEVLAAFAPYEKDRGGLSALFAAVRAKAASRLVELAKSGQNSRGEIERLAALTEIIDGLEPGLSQNVGGLLMSSILPAKFMLLNR